MLVEFIVYIHDSPTCALETLNRDVGVSHGILECCTTYPVLHNSVWPSIKGATSSEMVEEPFDGLPMYLVVLGQPVLLG